MESDPFIKGDLGFAQFYHDNLIEISAAAGRELIYHAELAGKTSIVEVGSGTGYLTKLIYDVMDENATIVSGDPSESMRQVASNYFKSCNLSMDKITHKSIDAQAIDSPDSSFDAFSRPFIMCHVPDSQKMMQEAFRVLKPKGVLLLADWDETASHDFFEIPGKIYGHPHNHGHHHGSSEDGEKKEGHHHHDHHDKDKKDHHGHGHGEEKKEGHGHHHHHHNDKEGGAARLVATPEFMRNGLLEVGFKRVFSWKRPVFFNSHDEHKIAKLLEEESKRMGDTNFPKDEEKQKELFEQLLAAVKEKLESGTLLGGTAVLTLAVKE
eukprot:CAMPEP_0115010084 /NCGR_PEP_ID=MMETSP0216-20121206/23068_1 /TAXON_ID=223996 /ORGANISM="Protocruzia adherens, Strain Boccale" /LENGTH=322 /DNA_ID=CAMNT_0002378157 /DNA_START=207 /DNA_END=1176 /DNA_ORIENTATION=-